ncbi:MAG: holo-ACP synthase [Candidatus Niameybacter stercoravium]|nr:holo-ACP synthase [Candidatus Niameybacter stercoravium]
MIIGIGNDIIEIKRIQRAVERTTRFLNKLLTPLEQERVQKANEPSYESIAGLFAAKEAVSKALGTGFVTFEMTDIEILKDEKGKPFVKLYNGARVRADEIGADGIHISISHCQTYATAFAIIERGSVSEACN